MMIREVWWHISAITCQIIMSTCQILCRLVRCNVDLSDNYVVICMALTGHVPVFMLIFLRRE